MLYSNLNFFHDLICTMLCNVVDYWFVQRKHLSCQVLGRAKVLAGGVTSRVSMDWFDMIMKQDNNFPLMLDLVLTLSLVTGKVAWSKLQSRRISMQDIRSSSFWVHTQCNYSSSRYRGIVKWWKTHPTRGEAWFSSCSPINMQDAFFCYIDELPWSSFNSCMCIWL